MFITGGLTPKNIGLILGRDSPFTKAYLDAGHFNPFVDTVPLFAVMTEDIGLRGARVCAERVSDFSVSVQNVVRCMPLVFSSQITCCGPLFLFAGVHNTMK